MTFDTERIKIFLLRTACSEARAKKRLKKITGEIKLCRLEWSVWAEWAEVWCDG